MNEGAIQKEMHAYAELAKWLDTATRLRQLFADASLPLPTPLQRLLSTDGVLSQAEPRIVVPPLQRPKPPGAGDDWIWVDLEQMTETGLAFSILRASAAPMKTQSVLEAVRKLKPDVVDGSIYNLLARYRGTFLLQTDDGWKLGDPESAAVIYNGAAWGPPRVFQKYELAAHRREIILHLLKLHPGGLMTMQIVNLLEGSNHCKAPINKYLLKADMEILQKARRVKRISNSRKWELA